MMEGKAIFKKNIEGGKLRIELADRIKSDKILEEDLFFLNKHLRTNFKKTVHSFKFIKVNQ